MIRADINEIVDSNSRLELILFSKVENKRFEVVKTWFKSKLVQDIQVFIILLISIYISFEVLVE